jgi:hypothetical protein
MEEQCEIYRNGELLGRYDQSTTMTLLRAGSLRLTDTYRVDQELPPAPLADLWCLRGRGRWHWLQHHHRLILGGVLVASSCLTAFLLWGASRSNVDAMASPAVAIESLDHGEIRKGLPVAVASLTFRAGIGAEPYPSDAIASIARPSSLSLICYDADGHARSVAGGVVVEDGRRVVTSLPALAGSHRIVLQLPSGETVACTDLLKNEEMSLALLSLRVPLVPLAATKQKLRIGLELEIAAHPLHSHAAPCLVKVTEVMGADRQMFRIDQPLGLSLAGAAILTRQGDLMGIVLDPLAGLALSVHSFRAGSETFQVQSLKDYSNGWQANPVQVTEAAFVDGQLGLTLKNQSQTDLSRIVLHLRCVNRPQSASELRALELQLNEVAVQLAKEAGEPVLLQQEIRRLSDRIDGLRAKRDREVLLASTEREELFEVAVHLPSGRQSRLMLDIMAGSGIEPVVRVIDASE